MYFFALAQFIMAQMRTEQIKSGQCVSSVSEMKFANLKNRENSIGPFGTAKTAWKDVQQAFRVKLQHTQNNIRTVSKALSCTVCVLSVCVSV